MRLIVQIPCFDEAETLPAVLRGVPRQVRGFDAVEVLVIDDGSRDGTADVARREGADHVLSLSRNRGLARAFSEGLAESLRLGADVIVNLDGDGQYDPADVPRLVEPILSGKANLVIGDREPSTVRHFSPAKRWLQAVGTWIVARVSGASVGDATSGFRALSREAALRINVVTDFTYTLETIVQAGKQHLGIVSVPVRSRPVGRPSRLFGSTTSYVLRSAASIVRLVTHYEPLKTFTLAGGALVALGGLVGARYLVHWLAGTGAGMVQSLILAAILIIVGFQIVLMGLLGDTVAANRRLLEEVLRRQRSGEGASSDAHRSPRRRLAG